MTIYKICNSCSCILDINLYNKDKTRKSGRNERCKQCCSLENKKRYLENKQKYIDKANKYKLKNPLKVKEYQTKYHSDNRVRTRPTSAACTAKRRCLVRNATPKWLNIEELEEIKTLYLISYWKTRILQKPYEVDHIVPIVSKKVCGLHVPWNLRVISQFDNRVKSNKILNV